MASSPGRAERPARVAVLGWAGPSGVVRVRCAILQISGCTDPTARVVEFQHRGRARKNIETLRPVLPLGRGAKLSRFLRQMPDPDAALNYLQRYLVEAGHSAESIFRPSRRLHAVLALFSHSHFLSDADRAPSRADRLGARRGALLSRAFERRDVFGAGLESGRCRRLPDGADAGALQADAPDSYRAARSAGHGDPCRGDARAFQPRRRHSPRRARIPSPSAHPEIRPAAVGSRLRAPSNASSWCWGWASWAAAS